MKVVGHFRHSAKASSNLRATILSLNPQEKKLKLVQDVVTRWNSTYLMLERLAYLCSHVNHALSQQGRKTEDLQITPAEFNLIQDLVNMLRPFFDATELLSGSKYTTVSLVYPTVVQLMTDLNVSFFLTFKTSKSSMT